MPLKTHLTLPRTNYTHTFIIIHGRGSTSHAISSFLSHDTSLVSSLPTFKFVFPQAPTRVSSNGDSVAQWFDVNPHDHTTDRERQMDGVREILPEVIEIIEREVDLLDGRWDRVVLGGFSQGGAVGVYVLEALERKLGAFVAWGCRGVGGLGGGSGEGFRTKVLLSHCVDDGVVKVEEGRALRDGLRRIGIEVEWREYPQGGHWFHWPEGIHHMLEFLKKSLRLDSMEDKQE